MWSSCGDHLQGGRILGPEVLVNTAAMRSLQGLILTPKNLAALKTMFQLVGEGAAGTGTCSQHRSAKPELGSNQEVQSYYDCPDADTRHTSSLCNARRWP
jgi:hypothetical protein